MWDIRAYIDEYLRYECGKFWWKKGPGYRARNDLIGKEAGNLSIIGGLPRWMIRLSGRKYYRSWLVILVETGVWPNYRETGLYVDHINQDSTDDRIENLRLVTPSESASNRSTTRDNFGRYRSGY